MARGHPVAEDHLVQRAGRVLGVGHGAVDVARRPQVGERHPDLRAQHRGGGAGLRRERGAELLGATVEVLAEREHRVDALLAPEPAPPAAVERAPGGEHGLLDLRERQRLDLGDRLLGGRVLDRERRRPRR